MTGIKDKMTNIGPPKTQHKTTKDCATYSEVNNFHIFIEHASCHNQDVAGLMKHCDDRDSLQGQ